MNIVYLLTFLDSQTGGMERQALQLANKLRERGCNIFFITCVHLGKMKKGEFKIIDTFREFKIYRIPIINGWRRLNAVIYLVGSLLILFLARKQYEIIHAHQLYTSGLVACAAKFFLRSKKVIVKNAAGGEFGDAGNLKRFPWSKHIILFIKKHVDQFVGVSAETAREMRSLGFYPVVQIPNAVDIQRFCPLDENARHVLRAEMLGLSHKNKVVLFVGRLGSEKNLFVLLDAIALAGVGIILLIVGDGELRDQLEEYVYRKGIKDKVVFWGNVNDVKLFFQAADVFVLPSHSEGLPNVLLEAMSCGVPSIGSNIAGIRAVISHGLNGYLFDKRDAEKLSQLITNIINNPKQSRMIAQNGRKTIEESFSLDRVVQEYGKLYESLCG